MKKTGKKKEKPIGVEEEGDTSEEKRKMCLCVHTAYYTIQKPLLQHNIKMLSF
jgi:hypothetical protein